VAEAICFQAWAAPTFCLGGSVGQTEGYGGQKTRAGASLSEVNPPQYPNEAYPEYPF